jgi:hypothetical protein
MPKKSTETKPEAAPAKLEETPTSQAPAGSLGGTPVVPMPKYNPYARVHTTTQEPGAAVGTPIRQSYEDVQQEAKGPGADEWREVDKARAKLSELYRNLQEDERFAEQYKSEQAWREYEKVRAQVEQLAPEAREKMLKSADGLERLSIPMPEGEGLLTKDTDKLLLTAHERSRIEGLLNRAEKLADKGPSKRGPHDLLEVEYERGIDEGGPGGGATVRAIVGLARDYGLDLDKIVDGRRKHYHYESLEDAGRARMRANMVGRSVPEPPFPHPRYSQPKDVGTYGRKQKAFIPNDRTAPAKRSQGRRRPSWK